MVFCNNLTIDLMAILTTIAIGAIAYLKWNLTYWSRKGLPCLEFHSTIFGDMKDVFLGRSTFGEQFQKIYRQFKSQGHKHCGVYMGPRKIYMPIDSEIIKHIMLKDFQHFMNHGNYYDEDADPLSCHLFNLEDTKWRNMRVKLTPTFTSGKMKMMFQTLADCTHGLKDIMQESALKNEPVDIKDILGRFTTDIIGSAAFGLDCNSLKDPNALFRKYGKKVFEVTLTQKIKTFLVVSIPRSILRKLKFRFTRKDVEDFYMKVVKDTVNYREQNNVYRKDFLHLLLQLKNRGKVDDDENVTDGTIAEKALTMNELAAQAFVFFVAGFETSSTAMTWALYELALNQDVQEKLREEINTVLEKHKEMTYDAIMDMHYMDNVISETLRKYPPLPILQRECTKDYTIPNTNIELKKGMGVMIPVLGLHTDPEYYPNPQKFDPDRFTEENKSARPGFTWLPFGDGPRLCIGLRFGLMQSKVGLTTLLRNYKVTLNSKTSRNIKLEPASFITTAKGGVWLDVEKIK